MADAPPFPTDPGVPVITTTLEGGPKAHALLHAFDTGHRCAVHTSGLVAWCGQGCAIWSDAEVYAELRKELANG